MMGLGKQEGDILVLGLAPSCPPCPDGEGSPRATRGQSSPIFINICLNHHPMPIIKNKDGFFVVVFLPPPTPLPPTQKRAVRWGRGLGQ